MHGRRIKMLSDNTTTGELIIAGLESLKTTQPLNMALAVLASTSAVIVALVESEVEREADTSLFHLPSEGSPVFATRKWR